MSIRRFVLAAMIGLAGMAGCDGWEGVAPERTAPVGIAGRWEWVEAEERSPERHVITPASTGESITLVLTRSASNAFEGSYEVIRNGDVVATGRYGVSCIDACGNDAVVWQPAIEGFAEMQWVTRWQGNMRLSDATVGGYEWVWRRSSDAAPLR